MPRRRTYHHPTRTKLPGQPGHRSFPVQPEGWLELGRRRRSGARGLHPWARREGHGLGRERAGRSGQPTRANSKPRGRRDDWARGIAAPSPTSPARVSVLPRVPSSG